MKKSRSKIWSAIEGSPDLVFFALIINVISKSIVCLGGFLLPAIIKYKYYLRYPMLMLALVFFLVIGILIDYYSGNS